MNNFIIILIDSYQMALISLRQLLDHAAENNYGVPAFNVNNLEQIRAIMEGAHEQDSPVIVPCVNICIADPLREYKE